MDKVKQTILAVDDEEGILKALRRLLRSLDVKVFTATSGKEGLEILKKEKVSLIISDQKMPEMTGVKFLSRSRGISPDSIRIMLTGYADINATVDAINSGDVKYYFNKPWDDEFFLSRIQESLDLYAAKEENSRLNELTQRQNEKLAKLNQTLEKRVAEQTKEIKEKHEELVKSFFDTIKALSGLMELHFKKAGSHSQRVSGMTKKLLAGFDLNQKEIQDIVIAAFLHDIGKIGLPIEILNKRDYSYTSAETSKFEQHPILGQSCMLAITGFEEISTIIRHHHENYDGSGYPDNLRGKRIPFGSRVIRIVDSFENHAFASDDPDFKAFNKASAYIVQFSGIKFDPDIVKKFIDLDIGKMLCRAKTSDKVLIQPHELREGMVTAGDVYTGHGVFLLPKGANLSDGLINRIIKIDRVDPIEKGVWVLTQEGVKKNEHAKV